MSPACTVSTFALTALPFRWLLLCFCLCASLLRVRRVAARVKVMVQVELATWSDASFFLSLKKPPLVTVVVASLPCVHCRRTCSSLACALTWVKMNETVSLDDDRWKAVTDGDGSSGETPETAQARKTRRETTLGASGCRPGFVVLAKFKSKLYCFACTR